MLLPRSRCRFTFQKDLQFPAKGRSHLEQANGLGYALDSVPRLYVPRCQTGNLNPTLSEDGENRFASCIFVVRLIIHHAKQRRALGLGHTIKEELFAHFV